MAKRKDKQKEMKQEETKQEEMQDQQGELQKMIDAKVKEGIAKALEGMTPKADTKPKSATQKEEFSKMGYKQRLELFKSDPAEYNKLAKGGE